MINLKQMCEIMNQINSGNECEAFFEGQGNGLVKFVIIERLINIQEVKQHDRK